MREHKSAVEQYRMLMRGLKKDLEKAVESIDEHVSTLDPSVELHRFVRQSWENTTKTNAQEVRFFYQRHFLPGHERQFVNIGPLTWSELDVLIPLAPNPHQGKSDGTNPDKGYEPYTNVDGYQHRQPISLGSNVVIPPKRVDRSSKMWERV